jgi:Poxvirus A32 protein
MISDFDFGEIKPPCRLIFTGRTNSGKSHAAMWCLFYLCDAIDEVIFMKSTLAHREFEDITSKPHIVEEFDEDLIEDICKERQGMKTRGEKMSSLLFFIDDCALDASRASKPLNNLFTKGRHWNVSIFMITQRFRFLSPAIRGGASTIFCSDAANMKDIEAIAEEYAKISKQKFIQLYEQCTENHGLLVINATKSGRVSYQRAKAPAVIPEFFVELCAKNGRTCHGDLLVHGDDEEEG